MRAVRVAGDWCRQGRHLPVATQRAALSRKLLGHCAYYCITGNHRALVRFHVMARRHGGGGCTAARRAIR